jgi:hypothetical protein
MSSVSLQASPDIENPDMESQESSECVHYWIIDVPSGPVSGGKCRLCGNNKEFRNYLEARSVWDDDRTSSQASTAGSSSLSKLAGAGVKSEEAEEN